MPTHPLFHRRGQSTSYDDADQFAYKGYLIKKNFMNQSWQISKDGHHIGSNMSRDAAKQTVDELVD